MVETNVDNQEVVPEPESIQKIRSWLGRDVKIEVTGGRVIRGTLACFDKQQNILLSNAYEVMNYTANYKKYIDESKLNGNNNNDTDTVSNGDNNIQIPKFKDRKELGIVIVPLKHAVSCLISKKEPIWSVLSKATLQQMKANDNSNSNNTPSTSTTTETTTTATTENTTSTTSESN